MKRKRNIIRLMAAPLTALLLATSCNNSYPGLYYEPDDVPSNDEDLKIEETPIKIYTRNPGFFTLGTRTTRGTGAFDNDADPSKIANSTFYVFAFRAGTGNDGNGGQGTLTMPVDLALSAYSPNHETANDRNNQSCLLDGENYYMGMPYKFVADGAVGIGDNSLHGALEPEVDYPIYYSGTYQDVGYNFFACYIDDWQPNASNTQRTKDGIVYNIELDGNRDLLLGNAKQLSVTDFEKDGDYYDLNLTKEERDRILGMAGGYSTYSGHRNVHPLIRMEHQLTRLVFQAYPGNLSADRVTITGITVEAQKSVSMKVAGKKNDDFGVLGFSQDKKEFKLCDKKDDAINADGFNTGYHITFDKDADKQATTTLGTSLLLAPAQSYKVYLHYTFLMEGKNGQPGEEKTFVAEYYINAPENDGVSIDQNGKRMFMPGVLYNIKIGVFGLEKIVMDAAVKGWEQGGDINIDPDNPGTPPTDE